MALADMASPLGNMSRSPLMPSDNVAQAIWNHVKSLSFANFFFKSRRDETTVLKQTTIYLLAHAYRLEKLLITRMHFR